MEDKTEPSKIIIKDWYAAKAFFNVITTGAFTSVGPLLAPVVKQDFRFLTK